MESDYLRIQQSLVLPKRPAFSQIHEGLDNGDFLFFNILNFFQKSNGGLFDYYVIESKEEK